MGIVTSQTSMQQLALLEYHQKVILEKLAAEYDPT